MRKLKVLSGAELLVVFRRFGFMQFSQRGSHAKRRETPGGRQTLTIALHMQNGQGHVTRNLQASLPLHLGKRVSAALFH
jgi:predicted RNA binding protein YcfA (HicA-like mRNA interferase family)